MALDQIKSSMESDSFGRNLNHLAKRELLTLDYMMNEHPARAEMFGEDSAWNFNLSDDLRASLSKTQNSDQSK
jgi:hypothetical protein